jgi:hypothetical protein
VHPSRPLWHSPVRVIATSYYRSYYRGGEFYDLIVAADPRAVFGANGSVRMLTKAPKPPAS